MNGSMRSEIVAYFTDEDAHFAPSQIDWVMHLAEGTAHDVIVDWWARTDAYVGERRRSYDE